MAEIPGPLPPWAPGMQHADKPCEASATDDSIYCPACGWLWQDHPGSAPRAGPAFFAGEPLSFPGDSNTYSNRIAEPLTLERWPAMPKEYEHA